MKVVADTSWLYALLDGRDAHHKRAKTEAADRQSVHVPPAVLVETMGLLAQRMDGGHGAARKALAALATSPPFVLADPLHDHDAAVRLWDHHVGLSYVDACAITAARRLGVGLLSVDKAQLKAHRSGRP